jgi:surface protein
MTGTWHRLGARHARLIVTATLAASAVGCRAKLEVGATSNDASGSSEQGETGGAGSTDEGTPRLAFTTQRTATAVKEGGSVDVAWERTGDADAIVLAPALYVGEDDESCVPSPDAARWTKATAQPLPASATSVRWRGERPGTYYFCITSGSLSATTVAPLEVDARPRGTIDLSENLTVEQGDLTQISYELKNRKGDETVTAYASTSADHCEDGTLEGWTKIGDTEGAGALEATTAGLDAGTYFVCLVVDDHINDPVPSLSTAQLVVKEPLVVVNAMPSIGISQPAGADDVTREGGTVDVVYSASDTDGDASVALYFKASAAGCNASLAGWTKLADALGEGADVSVAWATSGVSPGDYYVCASVTDGVNPPRYAVSSSFVHIDDAPTLSLAEPDGTGDFVPESVPFGVQLVATDADDAATMRLYYSTTNSGCDATLTGWTLASMTLVEGTDSSFSFQTAGRAGNSYYFCGVIDDGLNASVYALSPGAVTVLANAAPTVSVSQPVPATPKIAEAGSLDVVYTAIDADSAATGTLYATWNPAATCDAAGLSAWSVYATSLPEGTDATVAFSPGIPGTYYICVGFADGVSTVFATASGPVRVNDKPEIAFTAPSGNDDTVASGAPYSLEFAGTDTDNVAEISLFWKTTPAGCVDGSLAGWTLRAFGFPESTTTMSFTAPADGTYYICAMISDFLETTYVLSDPLLVGLPPTLAITEPAGGDDEFADGGTFNITLTGSDADSAATIDVYYKIGTGSCSSSGLASWTLLSGGLPENTTTIAFSPFLPADYSICGVITGGTTAVYAASPGSVRMNDRPGFAFTQPMGDDDTRIEGVPFTVQFSASDGDDAATGTLYTSATPANCVDGSLTGWTSWSAFAESDTAVSFQATPGTYYMCARLTDGLETIHVVSDRLVVSANADPTFTFEEPTGANDEIAESGSFNVVFTAADVDSAAVVSIRYRPDTNVACDAVGWASWTSLTSGLSEGVAIPVSFSPGVAGSYHFCARVNDEQGADYYQSPSYLVVNDKPRFSFAAPLGDDDTALQSAEYTLQFATQDDDDAATVDLYVNTVPNGCVNGTLAGWGAVASGVAESATSQPVTPAAAGTYYFCAAVTDGLETAYALSGSLVVSANTAPSFAFQAPIFGVLVNEGAASSVVFDLTDPDSSAEASIYYTDTSAPCDAVDIASWTLLAGNLAEGSGTTLGFSSVTPGTYRFCAAFHDEGPTAYAAATGVILVNDKPDFAFVQPTGDDDNTVHGVAYAVTYTLADTDSVATTAFYHKGSSSNCLDGSMLGWTSFSTGNPESGSGSVDFVAPSSGTYYLCAVSQDGREVTYSLSGSLASAVNTPPTGSIGQPAGADDEIAEAGTFSVLYSMNDSTAVAGELFYRVGTNVGCNPGGIGSWTSIASGLGEGTDVPQDFTPGVAGTYYFCLRALDEVNDLYTTGPSFLVVNDKPSFTFSEPMGGNDSVPQSAQFTVQHTITDADDDATTELYYRYSSSGCTDGDLTGWSFIWTIAEAGTTTTVNLPSVGTAYFCGVSTDGLETTYAISGALSVVGNAAPSLTFIEPTGSNDEIAEAGSFDVSYTASDADSVAAVVLYYRAGTSAGCDAGGIGNWTQFGTPLGEGTGITQALTPGAAGDYYVCALISDEVTALYITTGAPLHVNDTPSLTYAEPMGSNDTIQLGQQFSVQFAVTDADDDATVSLYYKRLSSAACDASLVGWVSFAAATETETSKTLTPPMTGTYYVCAATTDGLETAYSLSEPLIVDTNDPPTASFGEPAGGNDSVKQNVGFNVVYTAGDTDSDPTTTLFYRSGSNAGCDALGISNWAAFGLDVPEGANQTYALSSATIETLYVCLKTTDELASVYALAPGALQITDGVPPTPGTFEPFSEVAETSLRVTWNEASDLVSAVANLQYYVCQATDPNDVDTIAECLGQTQVMDWTAAATTAVASGLTAGTTYHFNVLVRDEADNRAMYGVDAETTAQPAFISTWNTQNCCTAPDQITLPLIAAGNYDFDVDWGDGTQSHITAWNQAEVTHIYAAQGVKTVTITGTIEGFSFFSGGDSLKLTNIGAWGPLRFLDGPGNFYGASNLTITATDAPDLTGMTTMAHMFALCYSLTTVPGMESWDTSAITDMSWTFYGARAFNQDLSGWNTANVTTMAHMFRGNWVFNQPIGGWDTRKVNDLSFMFYEAYEFNQPVNGWIVDDVLTLQSTFAHARDFNQPLNSWNVDYVTNMRGTFSAAYDFNQDITMWDVGAVTDMREMFWAASSFNQPIGGWNVANVSQMNKMFYAALAFNQNLGAWNVATVIDMSEMFDFVTLSQVNYDALLIGWSARTLQPNVVFDAGGSQFTSGGAAEAARDVLLNAPNNWTISDGGPAP